MPSDKKRQDKDVENDKRDVPDREAPLASAERKSEPFAGPACDRHESGGFAR